MRRCVEEKLLGSNAKRTYAQVSEWVGALQGGCWRRAGVGAGRARLVEVW